MIRNNFLYKSAFTLATILATAAISDSAFAYEYPTKTINAYDHEGNLVSTQMAADVSYIEIQNQNILPEQFTIDNYTFNMIPVIGTRNYSLGNAGIQWTPATAKVANLPTYYIGEIPVTCGLWKAVMGSLPAEYNTSGYDDNSDDDYPVVRVSWNDICGAGGFLEKLNEMLANQFGDREFCLPTEWEWEYAARGGNLRKTYTYSGSSKIDDVAWYNGYDNATANRKQIGTPAGGTQKVKLLPPNDLGIYDMSGNVWEWCDNNWSDRNEYRHNNGEYSTDRYTDDGVQSAVKQPMRGGSWNSSAASALNVNRDGSDAHAKSPSVGFRLVLKQKEPTPLIFTIPDTEVKFAMVEVTGTRSYQLQAGKSLKWNVDETYAIINDFLIGETEVTNAVWKAVMGSLPTGYDTKDSKDDSYPVCRVSWNDICGADGFLEKLNALMADQLDGKKFQLPTEWEWEFAASGGNHYSRFVYSGSDNIDDVAWYGKIKADDPTYTGNSGYASHPVKQKKPNILGIYDMSGNMWEWCDNKKTYRHSDGTLNENYQPLRGGGWAAEAATCRPGNRDSYNKINRSPSAGFRIILK